MYMCISYVLTGRCLPISIYIVLCCMHVYIWARAWWTHLLVYFLTYKRVKKSLTSPTHSGTATRVCSAPLPEAMPKCTLDVDLASRLEDLREIREMVRERRTLLAWRRVEVQGIASLSAISFNCRVMSTLAECYCSAVPDRVKSPPIAWLRKEAACFISQWFMWV